MNPGDASAALEVSSAELRRSLASDRPPLLIDVRRAEERARSRIEPSLHMPMEDVPARLQELGEFDDPIVVYCHLGQRSLHVTLHLRQEGFTDVRSLRGGIDHWERSRFSDSAESAESAE